MIEGRASGAWARGRVLVVDDDVDLSDALADSLRSLGHRVNVAHDGAEALDILRASRHDVIVLDLMMPNTSGWEFRVEQQKHPLLAEIPVIAMSASTSPVALAISAAAFFRKPVDARQLSDAIHRLIAPRLATMRAF